MGCLLSRAAYGPTTSSVIIIVIAIVIVAVVVFTFVFVIAVARLLHGALSFVARGTELPSATKKMTATRE